MCNDTLAQVHYSLLRGGVINDYVSKNHRRNDNASVHLEKDAENVLQYMASNGLIANASKTSLVILNLKSNKSNSGTNLIKVKIGEEYVNQEKSAKLLGISFNEKQNWKDQIYGKNGVITALNKLMNYWYMWTAPWYILDIHPIACDKLQPGAKKFAGGWI